MKKLIFLTLTLSLLCCGHKTEKEETYKAAETAKQKNAEEQLNLGSKYYYGLGVTKDYIKAVEYYRKDAEQGLAEAQFHLGLMYDKGKGANKDYVKAAEYYRKAAEQGDAKAQALLGNMYCDGQGVTKDYVQAYKWFNKAAAQGISAASKIRDLLEKEMTPDQIAKAQKESQEFKVKH